MHALTRHRTLNPQHRLTHSRDETPRPIIRPMVKVIAAEPASQHEPEAVTGATLHLGEPRPGRRVPRRSQTPIR